MDIPCEPAVPLLDLYLRGALAQYTGTKVLNAVVSLALKREGEGKGKLKGKGKKQGKKRERKGRRDEGKGGTWSNLNIHHYRHT